jgi:hypothetical protein
MRNGIECSENWNSMNRKWKMCKVYKQLNLCKDVIVFLFDIEKFWYS